MIKATTTIACCMICFHAFSQVINPYYKIPIRHDTAIQWAAECDKVVNLSPKVKEYSLKKWYLDKLRKGSVVTYKKDKGSNAVSSNSFSLQTVEKQDWLKGLSFETSHLKYPDQWYVIDTAISPSSYERLKYRGGRLNFSADPFCGCDEADAFRVKQVLNYKNGKFSIHNVFISPLCARQTEKPPFEWYPLCNVAYNDNAERKFPGLSKDVVLLNTDEVDYYFNREEPSPFDSVLTVNRTDIGSLIYQDVLKGRIKPVDPENGKPIPVNKFLTWQMPADTIPVLDINDPSKLIEYKVLQTERSSNEFNRLRIKQDLYFDFANERLYSVIRSVVLMLPVRMYDGRIRGYIAFCRLK